jgi:putative ABC transport system permease protein
MKEINPPRWADRFLRWYCNPELLEEIQGDAHELYFERVNKEGKRGADLKYLYDVIRFCRWSNIKRTQNEFHNASSRTLWSFNFKMASRNANRNKLVFAVKATGLSVCLAFILILTAYVINEVTFDRFHEHHDRIYRVTSKVTFQDHITHYAVTPLPIGMAMMEGIPDIENYTRFMYEGKPVYRIGEKEFHNDVTLGADSNFFKVFTFTFKQGNERALDEPNSIVLTETLSHKFFGDRDPLGQTIEFGDGHLLKVSAVINDLPHNSHLKFDALISWRTYERYDDWGNLNAYTYVLLKQDARLNDVKAKMPVLLTTFHELVAREYKATFEPIFEKVADIHFSETLDEDIAEKKNANNLFILIAVIILFMITALINYLNLSLAEITANLRKIGIIRIFGGMAGSHNKILLSDTLFITIIVAPVTVFLFWFAWAICVLQLGIEIDPGVLKSPLFMGLAATFIVLFIVSSQVNSLVLSRAGHLIHMLRGKLNSRTSGAPIRKVLVTIQLTFSITIIALIIVIVDQFRFIQEVDKGFDDRNTIVIKLRAGNYQEVETFNDRLRKLNGIAKVEGSSYYPGIIETKYVFQVETEKGMEQRLVPMMLCGYDYFNTLNIKMSEGRSFDQNRDSDRLNGFVINETAAREFGWKNSIGKKIKGPVDGQGGFFQDGEVIGVVRDFNYASLHMRIEPMIIFLTNEHWASQFIYIKTNPIRPPDLISTIEKEYKASWAEVPFEWEYLDSKYLSLYKKDHEVKSIFETGLVISVLISCLGIFSISALLSTLRLKEFGIRKVVGADSYQLFFLHSKSFLLFLIIAVLVAWPLIYYLSEGWLSNFAYHINLSAYHFLVPGLIAMVIVMCISSYHAIRNARINPVDILKYE